MDYDLKLFQVRESGFSCFPTTIETDVKIDNKSPILIEVSNWDSGSWCKGA